MTLDGISPRVVCCGGMSAEELAGLGRFAGPATLILSSLAAGSKHGYAITQDVESFAGVKLQPGTLYGALSRLEHDGLIEALAGEGRRRPYGITPRGARALAAQLTAQRRVAGIGLRRLSTAVTS
jgi:DNA-binding PadR family transcriptional regulator